MMPVILSPGTLRRRVVLLDEPAIVTYGRRFIDGYTEDEFRDALVRAFRDRSADFVVLDSNPHGQKFLAACAAWAVAQGLLYNDRNEDDTQQVVSTFRLTPTGRKQILRRQPKR